MTNFGNFAIAKNMQLPLARLTLSCFWRVYSSRGNGDISRYDEYTRHEETATFHVMTSILVTCNKYNLLFKFQFSNCSELE